MIFPERILIAHNTYQNHGGEETVVVSEAELLRAKGHQVELYIQHKDDIVGITKKMQIALHLTNSKQSRIKFLKHIKESLPDIVHVHNFFPLLTPSVFDACRAANLPVVHTLHNYRLICPNGMLFRNGKVCEICVTKSAYYSVPHKCYRNSYAGTFAVARMVEYHRRNRNWQEKVDRFIALTNFARLKFIKGGLPPGKIVVKPNFHRAQNDPISEERGGAIFVGRLSREKGIRTMLLAWNKLKVSLRIAGDGPMFTELKKIYYENRVVFLGKLSAENVCMEMKQAAYLIMPSEWYEGFPMVIVEAFANGLPVIGSKIGSVAEIIEDGVTGLLFRPGDSEDLMEKVIYMETHPFHRKKMGQNAYQVYKDRFNHESNYRSLIEIYKSAIADKK